MFGFVSGHAANSFGVAMIMGLMLRYRPAIFAMIIWANYNNILSTHNLNSYNKNNIFSSNYQYIKPQSLKSSGNNSRGNNQLMHGEGQGIVYSDQGRKT